MKKLCYSIHDLIKIEIESPSEEIERFFEDQIGYFRFPLVEEANLCINFVDEIKPKGVLRYIGEGAAYDDEAFYLIDRSGRKANLPMDRFGQKKIEVFAERKIYPMDLYDYVVAPFLRYQLVLQKMVFLHASSVSFQNKGILIPGWSQTGKTGLLLRFLEDKGEYMGDDEGILAISGRLYAYPRPLNLANYNYKDFPAILSRLGLSRGKDFYLKRLFDGAYSLIMPLIPEGSRLKKIFLRLGGLSKELVRRSVHPYRIFPQTKLKALCNLDLVFFLVTTSSHRLDILKSSKVDRF